MTSVTWADHAPGLLEGEVCSPLAALPEELCVCSVVYLIGGSLLGNHIGDHWLGDSGMVCLGDGEGTFQLKNTKSSSPDGSVIILGSGLI